MTSAEIMRQQMGATEQSDLRLRKTLARFSQVGRKMDTIVLPLELLKLKASDFSDGQEYHQWQRRQLKIMEAGLLLYPSVPLDRFNTISLRFNEILKASELRPIDTNKNSEAMRVLTTCVMALACRNQTGGPTEVCHWADSYPLNVHLYVSLLGAIFDLKDDTVVLDEVDELLELIKRTWGILDIDRMIHNLCFTWVIFEQYVVTGQVEPELIGATLLLLTEVAIDAKRHDRDPGYIRVLSSMLNSIQGWADKKLLDYHEGFQRGETGAMENIICIALATSKIINEDISTGGTMTILGDRKNIEFSSLSCVEQYIRSSIKNAFTKILETGNGTTDSMVVEVDENPHETLKNLVKQAEQLTMIAKDNYSPILRRWHPAPTAIAIATIHSCFRVVLKQYISRISGLTNELVNVMQAIVKFEDNIVQMAMDDLADMEDGGKAIMREMVPYEVDSIILNFMKSWVDDRLRMGRQCVVGAKDVESWNPKSKRDPYAQSAIDLMKLAKVTMDEFSEIQVGGRDELLQKLIEGFNILFQEYTSFVASCGSKYSYIPALPPLTRCNQDSRVLQFWKKASTPCKSGMDSNDMKVHIVGEPNHLACAIISRSTQRLCVRLNTLHYVLTLMHSVDKSLAFFSKPSNAQPPLAMNPRRRSNASFHFEVARSSIHAAMLHIAETLAYRLIFLDCAHFFYESLYFENVAESRIRPTIEVIKQYLLALLALINDRAQAMVAREVMKSSFECFVLVLLAGGSGRAFARSDCQMVAEDFSALKRIFSANGEGFISEEIVAREAVTVEGVIALMNMPTDKLVEEFSFKACEAAGLGRSLERVPMPPTTGRWHYSDPNTMLRVLCHRNDDVANQFLKRAFELPKRK